MIPLRNTFPEIVAAFRDIDAKLNSLLVGDIDMNNRKIVNAGTSKKPLDYVTRYELEREIDKLSEKQLRSLVLQFLEIGHGFPKIRIDTLHGVRVWDVNGQLIHGQIVTTEL